MPTGDRSTIAGRELRSRLSSARAASARLETLADAIARERDRARHRRAAARRSGRAGLARRRARRRRASTSCRTPPGCYTARDAVLHRAARPRGVRDRLGQARGHRRRAHAAARRARAARWPPRSSSTTASSSCPTRTTTPSSRAASRTSAARRSCRSARRSARGMGIRNPYNLSLIVEHAGVPVILDAGVGTASRRGAGDGARLRRACCARARSRAPRTRSRWRARSARGVEAGRLARGAGRIPRRLLRRGLDAGRGRCADVSRVTADAVDAAVDELVDRWQARLGGPRRRRVRGVLRARRPLRGPAVPRAAATASTRSADHAARLWAAFPDARVERTGERLTDGRFVAAPVKLAGHPPRRARRPARERPLRRRARRLLRRARPARASACGASGLLRRLRRGDPARRAARARDRSASARCCSCAASGCARGSTAASPYGQRAVMPGWIVQT